MSRPIVAPLANRRRSGINVIWIGTTISPTTTTNSTYRPLNSIHEKA